MQVVGFNVDVTRFLDAEGQLCAPLPDFARQPDTLRALYRAMVETRVFDKKATALQRAGQLGGYQARLGQEAIGAAIGGALRAADLVLPAHREPATQLLRGVAMHELFAYWSDPVIEDLPLPQAISHVASAPRGSGRVALVSCDGSATQAPVFHDLLASATRSNLPIVVVAASIARKPVNETRRQIAPLTRRALAVGIHAEAVDGNDVIATRHALDHAVERARRGGGPTVIEALSWQLHDGGDDGLEPRTDDELRAAWDRCPIKRLKRYIVSQSLWSVEQEEDLLITAGEAAESAARHFLGGRSGAR